MIDIDEKDLVRIKYLYETEEKSLIAIGHIYQVSNNTVRNWMEKAHIPRRKGNTRTLKAHQDIFARFAAMEDHEREYHQSACEHPHWTKRCSHCNKVLGSERHEIPVTFEKTLISA